MLVADLALFRGRPVEPPWRAGPPGGGAMQIPVYASLTGRTGRGALREWFK